MMSPFTSLKTYIQDGFRTEVNLKLFGRCYALGLASLLLAQGFISMPSADAWWLSNKKKQAEKTLATRVDEKIKENVAEKLKVVLPQIDNRAPYENVTQVLGLENRTNLSKAESALVDRYLGDEARTITNIIKPNPALTQGSQSTSGEKLSLKVDGIPVRMPVFMSPMNSNSQPMGSGAIPTLQPGQPQSAQPEAMSYLIFADPTEQRILNFINNYNKRISYDQARTISSSISEYSKGFAVDPHLLTSVLAVESSFNPYAISTSGAIGLGQLKPTTAQWLGVKDPFNPRENVYGTAKYLNFLLNRYNGSVPHAVAAYYKGQGTVDRQGIDSDAQYYISKVNKMLGQVRQ